MASDFDIMASTLTSNTRDINIIAEMLVTGALNDEQKVVDAYNSVVAAATNAEYCYNKCIASVDSIPFMVAASEDAVTSNLITAAQSLKSQSDVLLNVMANEFGIYAEDEEEEGEVDPEDVDDDAVETDEPDDEEDGEDLEDESNVSASENRLVASELAKASAAKSSNSSKSVPLFKFI